MQPIDLQTLFTQIDKVGRNQTQQKEGLQIQAALQQVQSQKKAEENVRAVNETQNMADDASKIKDEESRQHNFYHGKENEEALPSDDEEERPKDALIRDPALGRNIDISG
ncbi:MAG: hypothetical protein LBI14_04670 [Treponema sp.]|nr:hypothetical protein [Treponema sp.]